MDDATTVIAVQIYYACYFLVIATSQSFLIFLILMQSPKSLERYKVPLFNIAINQMVLGLCTFLLQPRIITSADALAVISIGYLKYTTPTVRFIVYVFITGSATSVALSVANTMLFKHISLTDNSYPEWKNWRNFFLFYTVPIFLVALPYIPTWDFEKVMNVTVLMNPHYDLTPYLPFPGFAETTHPSFLLANGILVLTSFLVPMFCFTIRNRIAKIFMKHSSNFSERTRTNTRQMIHCLTLESIIPVFCYIPMALLYSYSQITGQSFIIAEYTYYISCTFPCVIDPFLTFYYVTPYRQYIIHVFNPERVTAAQLAEKTSHVRVSSENPKSPKSPKSPNTITRVA